MDADAKKRVTQNIDPKNGINRELKKYFGYSPSIQQRRAVRTEVSTGKSFEGAKVRFNDTTYIKTGDNTYTKTKDASGENVHYNPKSDTYVVRNPETGKFEGIKDEKL